MNIKTSIAIGLLILLLCSNCTNVNKTNQPESIAILAERPPMGWNSWICFGTSVTEDEVKANADFMAENLKKIRLGIHCYRCRLVCARHGDFGAI